MKNVYVSIFTGMMLCAGVMQAVPAKRHTRTLTQPDGSRLTVTLWGDEKCHSYVTEDGLAVHITPEGHAVYRCADGSTQLYAHAAGRRDAAEIRLLAKPGGALSYGELRARALRHDDAAKVKVEQQGSQVPHTGTVHIPVILAEYTNISFRDGDAAGDTFRAFFSGDDKSVRKYFTDMSLGGFDPQFHVIGPVRLPGTRAYYGRNNLFGKDENVGQMVKDAIMLSDATTDFSIFDNDGDGVCDVVIVLYAGVGEASSNPRVSDAVWPSQWDLHSSGAGEITCDGILLDKFAVFNELNGTDKTRIDGIGTVCHEFSHCLGLPDFYEIAHVNGYFGMDAWSLMDYGCYNDDGYTPVGYSAYEKAYMGWMELTDVPDGTACRLPVLNDPEAPAAEAVVLPTDDNPDEYFIIENRSRQGWDEYIQDSGLMITHVTYDAAAWKNNTVNSDALQRMTIVPADNALTSGQLNGDLWPNGDNTEFTDTSVPAACTNSGGFLSRPVREMTRNRKTGDITFYVGDKQESIGRLNHATDFTIAHGELTTTAEAILHDVTGKRIIPSGPGHYTGLRGIYILTIAGKKPVKIAL